MAVFDLLKNDTKESRNKLNMRPPEHWLGPQPQWVRVLDDIVLGSGGTQLLLDRMGSGCLLLAPNRHAPLSGLRPSTTQMFVGWIRCAGL